MSHSTKTIRPLRQRMIEDMTMRKLCSKTQSSYLRHVSVLGKYLGYSPHRATSEDLRRYQLHMVNSGRASGNINAHLSGLRFFFEVTLDDANVLKKIKRVHQPRTIPQILSSEEVTELIEAAGSLKYQAALSIAYGAGLRRNEVVHVKVSDIDSDRMIIRVEQGKGAKDRNAMLSPMLLIVLCNWYRFAQAQHLMLPGGWLFPRQNPVNPLPARQLNRAFIVHAMPPVSTSRCRCIRYVTHLQRICWSRVWISASYRFCWVMRNLRPRHATVRWRPIRYVR